jgi:alpha-L-fucosidase 2
MGAWVAHLFYLHWRHTADDAFLRDRAYPFASEVGETLRALLKADEAGILKLPLSSSPEIFDNTRRAFVEPNSNYDLACLRMLFLALGEMAGALGRGADASAWLDLDRRLGPFHLGGEGGRTLLIDRTTPLPASHRHLSNLMAVHPFNLITVDGGATARETIAASLADWDAKGTRQWCGYSFSWMAALRARTGDAEGARRDLDVYRRAFLLRNGFHANGDQTKSGYSDMTYRPFTLEGNFLAMDAVHEMLLQSWSPRPGAGGFGPIRLFPATPASWADASFDDLRAEGGHRVSARREGGVLTWLKVAAGSDGPVRVRGDFGGRAPRWSRNGVTKDGPDYVVSLRRGEALEASFVAPSTREGSR